MIRRLILFLALAIPCMADDGIRVVSWPTPPTSAATASVGTISVSSSTVTLAPARTGRLKVTLFNEKETLYIKAGAGASITDYTWRMAAATSLDILVYSGPLTAVLGVVGPTTVHVSDF